MQRSTCAVVLIAILALSIAISTSAIADDGASGTGKVNAIMAAERKINLTHDPIPALGWPGMTMDFQLSESASLEGVDVGDTVTFELRKGSSGVYEIESLTPSKD